MSTAVDPHKCLHTRQAWRGDHEVSIPSYRIQRSSASANRSRRALRSDVPGDESGPIQPNARQAANQIEKPGVIRRLTSPFRVLDRPGEPNLPNARRKSVESAPKGATGPRKWILRADKSARAVRPRCLPATLARSLAVPRLSSAVIPPRNRSAVCLELRRQADDALCRCVTAGPQQAEGL